MEAQQQTGSGRLHARLAYKPSTAVSRKVVRELVDSLVDLHGADPAEVQASIQRNPALDFNVRFSVLGLRADNLADATAAYWLAMWCVIHDRAMPAPEQVPAVVRQVSGYLAASPLTRNEAQRQMMAEALIWETLLLLDAQRQARDQGRPEALQQMAQSARATMLKRGMDLGSMELTPRGFERRG